METLTIRMSPNLKKELQKHKEVNWSNILRQAMRDHLRRISAAEHIAQKSKLTKKDVDEIDRVVRRGLAKIHRL